MRSETELVTRCRWSGGHPLLQTYHDVEWGVPTRHRERLFELLILEGAQAGLSWLSILKRREGYREAFEQFNPDKVRALTEANVMRLLQYPGIIRNGHKIRSAIGNADAFVRVEQEWGGFDRFLWSLVQNQPIIHHFNEDSEVPAFDELSTQLSRALRHKGFSFVGPTICYSYLQATGIIMDHVTSCFRYQELIVS